MIPAQVRIFVCTDPVDMRCGFDRLALLARERVDQDPRSGALFVFRGRRATRLKILWFDHNGYCLLYKRLHASVFVLPMAGANASVQIDGAQLATILQGQTVTRRKSARRPKRQLTVDPDELSMQP
jgi:transposase